MVTKSKTSKRIALLDGIIKIMEEHEWFSEIVARKKDTEGQIKKALFLRLRKDLPNLFMSLLNINASKASDIANKDFKWEQNRDTIVKNFTFFNTSHRPDAELTLPEGIRIAIEIKKGQDGGALRSGIGQSVVYSQKYDFVLYFFVDTSDSASIKSAYTGVDEEDLIKSLWNNYNIRFFVV